MDKNRYLVSLCESEATDFGRVDFAAQSPQQQVFSAIWALESGVNTGGFASYFASWPAAISGFAPTALEAIGAHSAAAIVSRALAVVAPAGLPDSDDARADLVAGLSADQEAALGELDSEFMAYPDNLTDLLFEFVARHPEAFGSMTGESPEAATGPTLSGAPDVALGQHVAELRSARDAFSGRMLRSGALMAGGLAISAWTYMNAMAARSGGVYFIFFGAVIYGGGGAYVAWTRLRKVKRALAAIDAQYGGVLVQAAVDAWADALLGPDAASSDEPATPRALSGPPIATGRVGRVLGYVVIAFGGAVVIVPTVLILASGFGSSLISDAGVGGALLLALINLGVGAAIGYVGWRLAFQSRS